MECSARTVSSVGTVENKLATKARLDASCEMRAKSTTTRLVPVVSSKPAPTYAALFEKRGNKVVDDLGQLGGIVETLQSQSHAVWG